MACTVSQISVSSCLVLKKKKKKLTNLVSHHHLCFYIHSYAVLTYKPWSKVNVLNLCYFIFNLFCLLSVSLAAELCKPWITNLFICLPVLIRKALFMTELYLYFKGPCQGILWLLCVYIQMEVGEKHHLQLTSIFTTGVWGGGCHPTCVLREVLP